MSFGDSYLYLDFILVGCSVILTLMSARRFVNFCIIWFCCYYCSYYYSYKHGGALPRFLHSKQKPEVSHAVQDFSALLVQRSEGKVEFVLPLFFPLPPLFL